MPPHIRHVRKKVPIEDVEPKPAEDISQPPTNKKRVKNIYYDPDTQEIVLEIEE